MGSWWGVGGLGGVGFGWVGFGWVGYGFGVLGMFGFYG
jgi:hypothetical protein